MSRQRLKIKQKTPSRKLEFITLISFITALSVISFFHEPWFDEAQAWQIARCADWKDILWRIPHAEGHPALWHLILAIPAKCGVPFEIGLKVVGILFMGVSVAILLFFSPFPRIIRNMLPFSYFLFYQYGVNVRPYCMMFLAFLLMALIFGKKKEHPFLFVFTLVFLCMTSAYGIILAGGIAFAWMIDIIGEKRERNFCRHRLDQRWLALLLLLAAAILIMIEIYPDNNANGINKTVNNYFYERLLVAIFCFLADVVSPLDTWCSVDVFLTEIQLDVSNLIVGIFLGILIWILIWIFSSKRMFKYFALPYIFFAVFCAGIYACSHHEGIAVLLLIFWGWINIEENEAEQKQALDIWLMKKRIRKKGVVVVAILLVIPIYWSVASSVAEINYTYGYGRDAAKFIKESNIEKLPMMTSWRNQKEIGNTSDYNVATEILPYFETNIISNYNMGKDEKGYLEHRVPDYKTNIRNIKEWGKMDIPEVLIGDVNVELIFGQEVSHKEYVPVYEMKRNYIWKGRIRTEKYYIYRRRKSQP